jgi:mannose/fructose/N-acetylgalactosamine-specific phosphotransferase system component IID
MTGSKLPYRGWFWRPKQRAFTLCVLERESNNHWFSTNRSAGYFGGFQFNKALKRGATYMITPELQALFGMKKGKQVARMLRATPMHKWHPWYQHAAFATVLNWEADYSGKQHWAGGRWTC